ncbi:hypothetical protein Poli38472_010603 [Pythium oligandrum]|uniref:Uncharacterized protein n=1 Tax=Pythium oligandrum TaxID=41045 RepID=A0A8K1C3E3_PYTOL|nr:hypothetical protein Poli38472_010603 [Pythium oligandrum]|eukprot:TMW55721.1 hypothetical protein Poli38472_010603 [Pythium oligandrum]
MTADAYVQSNDSTLYATPTTFFTVKTQRNDATTERVQEEASVTSVTTPLHPLERVGWLSKLTLAWMNPIIRRGLFTPLREDDVWPLPQVDRTEFLHEKFNRSYTQAKNKRARVSHALWSITKRKMLLGLACHLFYGAISMFQALLIKALLQYLQGEANLFSVTSGYTLAGLLSASALVGATVLDYGMFVTARAGVNARTIAISTVYQKLLRVRLPNLNGEILALMSVDGDRLADAFASGLWVVVSPLTVTACCLLIGFELGVHTALAALACIGCVLVFVTRQSKKIAMLRRELCIVTSERVKLTQEVLHGIRDIKMNSYEALLEKRVLMIRSQETALSSSCNLLRVSNTVLLSIAPMLTMAVSLIMYVYFGHKVTIPKAFTLLALVNTCHVPFGQFSNAVVGVIEGVSSIQRISTFITAPETEVHTLPECEEPAVELVDADFTWNTSISRPILQDINISIQPGSLTIVVGAVGSGKSSLINALLGEMYRVRGTTDMRGSIAYASQQAWIQHCTIRDNVLFGEPFDQQHYDAVISACQMRRDLDELERGDATEISERDAALNSSLKTRVGLARVIYRRESDVVLLDDPFSALDARVASKVFFECVMGLVKTKTRVLVLSSHFHLLPQADRIVVLSKGRIVGDGVYDEVAHLLTFLPAPVATEDFVRDFEVINACDSHEDSAWGELLSDSDVHSALIVSGSSLLSDCDHSPVLIRSDHFTSPSHYKKHRYTVQVTTLEEEEKVWSVSWRVHTLFLALSGWNSTLLCVLLVGMFLIAQSGLLAVDFILKLWTEGSLDWLNPHAPLWFYVEFVIIAGVLVSVSAVFLIDLSAESANRTQKRAFQKVIRAPLASFFGVTPVTRILSRFSRDLDQLDNFLPSVWLDLMRSATNVLSIAVVCGVVTPTVLVLYPPILSVSHYVQAYFHASSRELKRLDGVTRSPFLNLVVDTANGPESIRSFGMAEKFLAKSREMLDYNSKFFFMYQTSSKWFAMRLDWFVSSIVVVVAFTCVASRDSIEPASAGMALTYAVQLSMQFQRLVTLGNKMEAQMASLERIARYFALKKEGVQDEIATSPQPTWPFSGFIEFDDVYLRYQDDLDYALCGLSFTIQDGLKVGVCCRTGSGNSAVMNALFRTVELAQGSIRIDGVDIASISLHALRSKLTIIPQDPVLFSGTLRDNLDPFNDKTDDELFGVLRKVHLMDDASKWGAGLSHQVTEKGDNLSVGQRQLICIARALLRDSRIIVLDEATANVDQDQDRLIHVSMKENFEDRTVLTIAHRLESIADSDRILVMDHGVVAEYDSPSNLLQKPNGIFASLMESMRSAYVDEDLDSVDH